MQKVLVTSPNTIQPMASKKTALLSLGFACVVLAGAFVATGVSLVPTKLMLGPCLKDWTSPVSYRPRVSPLAALNFSVGDASARLCYGRPIGHGRVIFGKLVPYDSLWRMGANEPTRLYTNGAISLAGIPLPAGRYSVYTIPHPDRWEVFVTRSTRHWGNDISAAVRAQEVGHADVPVSRLASPVDTFTIRADSGVLDVEWETTRASIPFSKAP